MPSLNCYNRRSSVMVEHRCCDAANLVSVSASAGCKNNRQEPIADKSYSAMQVIENSIAAAWCGGVTISLPSH